MTTLYTLDSLKKIRVFSCKITQGTAGYVITTSTGLLNGKLIDKNTLVTKGKQNRTVEEQANLQAKALINEKYDEGYKSEDQLVKALVSKGLDTPVVINALITHCNHHIPNWYQTNANWDELPMLAHKFKDIKKPTYPYYGQPKLDGVRCFVKLNEAKTGVKLISRGGQYYQIPHLEAELITLFYKLKEKFSTNNIILDGEIYKHGKPLQEISGAARKEESGMFASNSWLEYHIYDIIVYPGNQTQEKRLEYLNCITDSEHIKKVNTIVIANKDEVDKAHQIMIMNGYEGLILRNPQGLYQFNQRSKDLLKVKEYKDEEFVIIGCEIDTNKTIEDSFVFVLKNNTNDLTFKARPTGTGEMKKHWYENIVHYHGEKATVRFFARSNDGLPTQGVVRDKETEILHIRPYGE